MTHGQTTFQQARRPSRQKAGKVRIVPESKRHPGESGLPPGTLTSGPPIKEVRARRVLVTSPSEVQHKKREWSKMAAPPLHSVMSHRTHPNITSHPAREIRPKRDRRYLINAPDRLCWAINCRWEWGLIANWSGRWSGVGSWRLAVKVISVCSWRHPSSFPHIYLEPIWKYLN